MVILDVVDGRIKCVEVLYREEIRCKLQELPAMTIAVITKRFR